MSKYIWAVWVNVYVNYLGEVHFSKGYFTKGAAMLARRKHKGVQYLGEPMYIKLKK